MEIKPGDVFIAMDGNPWFTSRTLVTVLERSACIEDAWLISWQDGEKKLVTFYGTQLRDPDKFFLVKRPFQPLKPETPTIKPGDVFMASADNTYGRRGSMFTVARKLEHRPDWTITNKLGTEFTAHEDTLRDKDFFVAIPPAKPDDMIVQCAVDETVDNDAAAVQALAKACVAGADALYPMIRTPAVPIDAAKAGAIYDKIAPAFVDIPVGSRWRWLGGGDVLSFTVKAERGGMGIYEIQYDDCPKEYHMASAEAFRPGSAERLPDAEPVLEQVRPPGSPIRPEDLAGALQNPVHREVGVTRPAKTVKVGGHGAGDAEPVLGVVKTSWHVTGTLTMDAISGTRDAETYWMKNSDANAGIRLSDCVVPTVAAMGPERFASEAIRRLDQPSKCAPSADAIERMFQDAKCAPGCTPAEPCRTEDVCPVWNEEVASRATMERDLRETMPRIQYARLRLRRFRKPYEPPITGRGGAVGGIWFLGKVGK